MAAEKDYFMEKKDLEQIGEVIDEQLVKALPKAFNEAFATTIWEHNLEPGFNRITDSIDKLENRMDKLEARMDKLEKEMVALSAKVTNYLELSDKRYLELKRKNFILAKWVQQIADKTGVKIDLKELEEVSS